MTIFIDTFQFITALEKSGLKEEGAKMIAKTLVDMQTDIVTKDDLKVEKDIFIKENRIAEKDLGTKIDALNTKIDNVEKDLTIKIDNVEANLRQEIKMSEQRMVIKIGGMIVATIAIITWLQKLIH